MVFCGMALGHGDPAAPVNQWRAPREDVDGFAAFLGFRDADPPPAVPQSLTQCGAKIAGFSDRIWQNIGAKGRN